MSAAQNDQVKLRKRLEVLLKLPDNLTCADCRKRGPRWASANLGIFICIECSGIHRNLGVHISFVRSVNLDSWTKQQVEFMEEWGNKRANEYFEANVPSHVIRPKEGDSVRVVERYIRDKYEFRKYIAKALPPKHEVQAVEEEPEPEPVVARKPKHHGHHHSHHHHQNNHHEAPKPTEAPKPVPAPVAAAPAPSLLDFMDDPAPAPAPVPVASSVDPFGSTPAFPAQPAAPATPAFDPFASQPFPTQGGFAAPNPAPPAQHQPQNNFPGFAAPPAAPAGFEFMNPQQPPQQPQQPQQPPKASADAILSLYAAGNRGGPMPMAGGFGQPMYPQNQAPPMMNVNPNQGYGAPRPPVGYGQPVGYPQYPVQQPYPGFNPAAPPVNPFAPPGGMPGQGYPPQQFQYQQPPANPFSGLGNPNQQYQQQQQYQQGWQR